MKKYKLWIRKYNLFKAEILKNIPKNGKKNPKSKAVYQISREWKIINEFGGIREAERWTGFYASHISKCCKKEIKSYKNYIWKYKDEVI